MDGASLGFSLINRPAAGRCVFSTSLLGQDDVHGTTGWAGRRACVLQRTYTIGCTKSTRPRYNGPSMLHPSTNRATHGARHSIRAVLTCMCHVDDQPRRAYVRILYTRWSRPLLLLSPLSSSSMGQACSTFTCADRSRSSARNKRRTRTVVI